MSPIDLRIFNLIPEKARVLDLGCGDGALLHLLEKSKAVEPLGLEFNIERIKDCVKNGVPVLQMDLDRGLPAFRDKQFDVAILQFTLSEVQHPLTVFREMLRVADQSIIVINNFAHWRVRLNLLLRGKTPITPDFPYEWYNTPNLHFISIEDIVGTCEKEGVEILHKEFFAHSGFGQFGIQLGLQNLLANSALFHIKS
jgi:methionine biosynthesis protein MetW